MSTGRNLYIGFNWTTFDAEGTMEKVILNFFNSFRAFNNPPVRNMGNSVFIISKDILYAKMVGWLVGYLFLWVKVQEDILCQTSEEKLEN